MYVHKITGIILKCVGEFFGMRLLGSIRQAFHVVSVPQRDEGKEENGITERIER